MSGALAFAAEVVLIYIYRAAHGSRFVDYVEVDAGFTLGLIFGIPAAHLFLTRYSSYFSERIRALHVHY